jgi:acyl carrier protein
MTLAEFISEFAEVLLEEPEKLKPEVDLTSFEAWDSAAAINLIVLLEELGVEIDEDKIRACTTVQDVLSLTGDKLQ